MDFGTQARSGREAAAKEIFESFGSSPRKYRNGLGLAVPAAEQIEILRRSIRYLIAIERIREKSKQLNLTDEQKSQLREQEATRTASTGRIGRTPVSRSHNYGVRPASDYERITEFGVNQQRRLTSLITTLFCYPFSRDVCVASARYRYDDGNSDCEQRANRLFDRANHWLP